MIKILDEICGRVCLYLINLSKEFICFFLTVLSLWLISILIDFLFPNPSITVRILELISYIATIIHFTREHVYDLIY